MTIDTFIARRDKLRETVPQGGILFLGHDEAARNYANNPYPFRQNSNFLYYVGTNEPNQAVLIAPDGETTFFGSNADEKSIVWQGPRPSVTDYAKQSGIDKVGDFADLADAVERLQSAGEKIHFTPMTRGDSILKLGGLLGLTPAEVTAQPSRELARAISEQRSIKSETEVKQIETALSVSGQMYQKAIEVIRPGIKESTVCGAMMGIAAQHNMPPSFLPIVTRQGEVLHNNIYQNTLSEGDLLLMDTGVEAPPSFHCSDITRTYPVSGRYDSRQKDIIQIVLEMQRVAIDNASAKVSNADIHLMAAQKCIQGFKALGIFTGDEQEALDAAVHTVVFPHGIGHMLGVDVHDMEDLGEFAKPIKKEEEKTKASLSTLRLSKKLQPGFVITIEPGIYFIPVLINRWKAEKKLEQFINYKALEKFIGFGGIRIEDDVLITETGCRVLGPQIPKSIQDVENAFAKR